MEKKHTKKNNSLMQAFIGIAKANGEIHPKEKELLLQFGNKIGFTTEEIKEQIAKTSNYNELQLSNNISNKLTLIMDFFRMAVADGQIDDKEIDLLKAYSLQLGYREDLFFELVEDTKNQLNLLQSA